MYSLKVAATRRGISIHNGFMTNPVSVSEFLRAPRCRELLWAALLSDKELCHAVCLYNAENGAGTWYVRWDLSTSEPVPEPKVPSLEEIMRLAQRAAEQDISNFDAVDAMDGVICDAMYWQAPFDPLPLHPLADAALNLAAPEFLASEGWSTLLRSIEMNGPLWTAQERLGETEDQWSQWSASMRAREDEARAWPENMSSVWWSCPPTAEAYPMGFAAEWIEDWHGETELSLRPVEVGVAAREYVIDSLADWVRLVEQYPLEVTFQRRGDWGRATGRKGRWFMPDYGRAARDWDVLTLTVRGYLTAAGAPAPVATAGGDGACLLAGWSPGHRFWLNPGPVVGEPVEWRQVGPGAWEPT